MSGFITKVKYNVFELVSKFDTFKGYARSIPANVGLCVHCERTYDDAIYNKMLNFSRFFKHLTGKRLIVCVLTPLNPLLDRAMKNVGFDQKLYKGRVEALSEFCEIGYHGHFYRKEKNGGFTQINGGSPYIDTAKAQIKQEITWFHKHGFKPYQYVAGWWFLNEGIILQLESHGIEVDFSIRRSGEDTFGGRYLDEDKRPFVGKPFILPPSRNIIEIQTVFGPISHPYIVRKHLIPYMQYEPGEKTYLVFSIHDWDLLNYYREIKNSVEFVAVDSRDFKWSSFDRDEIKEIRETINNDAK